MSRRAPRPAPPSGRLVVAVSSSALFDLRRESRIHAGRGLDAYRTHQRRNESRVLRPGVAFPFVRRLLAINALVPDQAPVEVVLVSRHDADAGMRIRHSIEHHGLAIGCTVFTGGHPPWPYLDAFGACLFLSANQEDVDAAIAQGFAAGLVLAAPSVRDDEPGLRIAFDFDSVLADDEGDRIYHRKGMAAWIAHEAAQAAIPHAPGPLHRLLAHIARLQRLLARRPKAAGAPAGIRTAIVTARSAPADRRVVTTLRAWGIAVDEAYFIGDLPKARILRRFRPHIFFDDKRTNAELAAAVVPAVHVPFGINNRRRRKSRLA